jgi:hypothetical protein
VALVVTQPERFSLTTDCPVVPAAVQRLKGQLVLEVLQLLPQSVHVHLMVGPHMEMQVRVEHLAQEVVAQDLLETQLQEVLAFHSSVKL